MIELEAYLQIGKYPETIKETFEFVQNYCPNGLKISFT